MIKKTIFALFAAGAVVTTLGLGAFAIHTAKAAVAQQTSTPNTQLPQGRMPDGRGFRGGVTDESLAAALGINVDDLAAAYQKANEALLAQAVKDGLITQTQADQLAQHKDAFPLGRREGSWMKESGLDFDQYLANALGITPEKLSAARLTAFFAQVDQEVTGGNLTSEQADLIIGQTALYANTDFQSTMQSAFETAVNKAVISGVITQAQADQILKLGNGMGFPGPKGMGGFFPPMGGEGFPGLHGFGKQGGLGEGSPVTPPYP